MGVQLEQPVSHGKDGLPVAQIVVRPAPPSGQCPTDRLGAHYRVAAGTHFEPKAIRVHDCPAVARVTRRRGLDRVGPEHSTKAANVRAQRGGRRPRHVHPPERIDDAIAVHGLVTREGNNRQERPLLGPFQSDPGPADADGEGAEHAELHRPNVLVGWLGCHGRVTQLSRASPIIRACED